MHVKSAVFLVCAVGSTLTCGVAWCGPPQECASVTLTFTDSSDCDWTVCVTWPSSESGTCVFADNIEASKWLFCLEMRMENDADVVAVAAVTRFTHYQLLSLKVNMGKHKHIPGKSTAVRFSAELHRQTPHGARMEGPHQFNTGINPA